MGRHDCDMHRSRLGQRRKERGKWLEGTTLLCTSLEEENTGGIMGRTDMIISQAAVSQKKKEQGRGASAAKHRIF